MHVAQRVESRVGPVQLTGRAPATHCASERSLIAADTRGACSRAPTRARTGDVTLALRLSRSRTEPQATDAEA